MKSVFIIVVLVLLEMPKTVSVPKPDKAPKPAKPSGSAFEANKGNPRCPPNSNNPFCNIEVSVDPDYDCCSNNPCVSRVGKNAYPCADPAMYIDCVDGNSDCLIFYCDPPQVYDDAQQDCVTV